MLSGEDGHVRCAVWMTPRQAARARECGDVLVLGGSSKAMVGGFFCLNVTAMDAYGKPRALAYALAEKDSPEMVRFVLASYREMAPFQAPSAVFASHAIIASPSCITDVFPAAKPLLCCVSHRLQVCLK